MLERYDPETSAIARLDRRTALIAIGAALAVPALLRPGESRAPTGSIRMAVPAPSGEKGRSTLR
jgi:hypothetical protein